MPSGHMTADAFSMRFVCVRAAVCAHCRRWPKQRFAQWKLRAVTRVSALAAISRGLFSLPPSLPPVCSSPTETTGLLPR